MPGAPNFVSRILILQQSVIVKLLIESGADLNPKDFENKTPLDEAIKCEHSEISDLLRKHGGKTGGELKAEGK